MTYFVQQGASWRVSATGDMIVKEKLPPRNYTVKKDPFGNLYLDQIAGFTVPPRIYGDTTARANRILNTFNDRNGKSTGVLLSGEKGSGKTMLAKLMCINATEMNMPVIVINHPCHGDDFNLFIQSIEQSAVVLFDEFEKVYDRDEQQHVLTLLDGVYPTHKLFILTCNNSWALDTNLINRPGRIYYNLAFKGLEAAFIEEYCRENLKNQDHVENVQQVSCMFADFNFDLLQTLVEEMNRYGESAAQVLPMLNIKPERATDSHYDIMLMVDNRIIALEDLEDRSWRGNPMMSGLSLDYKSNKAVEDGDDWEWETVTFTAEDLVRMNPQTGQFVFINDHNSQLTLTRKAQREFHYGLIA